MIACCRESAYNFFLIQSIRFLSSSRICVLTEIREAVNNYLELLCNSVYIVHISAEVGFKELNSFLRVRKVIVSHTEPALGLGRIAVDNSNEHILCAGMDVGGYPFRILSIYVRLVVKH